MKSSQLESTNFTLDVVLLTAGQSSRLGTPKQHASLGGKSLLERRLELTFQILDTLPSKRKPIMVSGAYLQQDCRAMADLGVQADVTHLYNADWNEGIESSLACARSSATARGVLILLVDQYRLSLEDLLGLYKRWTETPQRPAAARFAGTIGPPVIWPQRLWSAQATENHALNKNALRASAPTLIDLPNAEYDVDTSKDLERAFTFIETEAGN